MMENQLTLRGVGHGFDADDDQAHHPRGEELLAERQDNLCIQFDVHHGAVCLAAHVDVCQSELGRDSGRLGRETFDQFGIEETEKKGMRSLINGQVLNDFFHRHLGSGK